MATPNFKRGWERKPSYVPKRKGHEACGQAASLCQSTKNGFLPGYSQEAGRLREKSSWPCFPVLIEHAKV